MAQVQKKFVKKAQSPKRKVLNTSSESQGADSAKKEEGPKVVTTYNEKRNAFYKLGYNEQHIPN